MTIQKIEKKDLKDVAQLAFELWPDASPQELLDDFTQLLRSGKDAVYICKTANNVSIAFLHASLRGDYVEGTASSPVAYLEGIYVRPAYQRQGIARKLLETAEKWAKNKGCTEMGSDAEVLNLISQKFHEEVGFVEANRVVCYAKRL